MTTSRLSASHTLILGGLVLTSLSFIPVLFATTFTSKLLIILGLALALGASLAVKAIKQNAWHFRLTPVTTALFGMAIATAATIFFAVPYPAASLFGLGGFLVVTLLAAWLAATTLFNEVDSTETVHEQTNWAATAQHSVLVGLTWISALLALTSVLQLLGIGPSQWFNSWFGLNLPTDLRLSLAGSPLAAAQIGLLTVVAWGMTLWQTRRWSQLSLISIASGLLVMGLSIWAMLPGKTAAIALPNWAASWSVALDTLRTPRTALIGFGTDGYATAFTRFRPIWLNGLPNWQIGFGSGSNWPLTLIVTQGLFGLVTWVWVLVASLKLSKETSSHLWPLVSIVLVSFGLQLVMPLQVSVLVIQLLALAFLVVCHPGEVQVLSIKSKQLWPAILGWAVLALVAWTGWYYSKYFMAYYYLYQADKAAFHNQPADLYDYQRKAVVLSPHIDLIRRQYAMTNLQLALALSSNKNATDADRAQITQLVSQAIREAKAATILDPGNTQNWVALAEIYRNLSVVSAEANQWTVGALVSAIGTDPTNPVLRLDLGQVLFDQKLYEEAVRSLNQAIELKPDFAGGYFQLGRAMRMLNQFDKAKVLLEKAQSLLPVTSEEYRVVGDNLKELEAASAAASQSAKKGATAPAPTATPTPSAADTASGSALLRLTQGQQPSLVETDNVVDNPSTQAEPSVAPQN
jgi:tetratricopeptide (TPR) repeat protein